MLQTMRPSAREFRDAWTVYRLLWHPAGDSLQIISNSMQLTKLIGDDY